MPDEAQHLTAAKPESASGPAAEPASHASQAQDDARGPVEHDRSAPVDKPDEQPRPKPAPPEPSSA
ncbi:hypothetical protein, partial [Streptomyces sp. IBSBF 2806]|uniref:hypothetical protein n=1 Tax=Streptomyces sp. IBSBF 2806 TaxID=2903529 RepID=UPI002FDC3226